MCRMRFSDGLGGGVTSIIIAYSIKKVCTKIFFFHNFFVPF